MADRKQKYEGKRKKVTISFNLENEQDLKRLDFVKTVDFSNWVKQQIDIEIEQKINSRGY